MTYKLPYETLAITLFSKCTAKCKMCCFSCTPESTERIDEEHIMSLIKQTQDMDMIKMISFTGGEPFLEYDNLCKYVEMSTALKKKTSV